MTDAEIKRERKSHIWAREANEHYAEPAWCSRRLFEEETFGTIVHDPCCGFGRIPESDDSDATSPYLKSLCLLMGAHGFIDRLPFGHHAGVEHSFLLYKAELRAVEAGIELITALLPHENVVKALANASRGIAASNEAHATGAA